MPKQPVSTSRQRKLPAASKASSAAVTDSAWRPASNRISARVFELQPLDVIGFVACQPGQAHAGIVQSRQRFVELLTLLEDLGALHEGHAVEALIADFAENGEGIAVEVERLLEQPDVEIDRRQGPHRQAGGLAIAEFQEDVAQRQQHPLGIAISAEQPEDATRIQAAARLLELEPMLARQRDRLLGVGEGQRQVEDPDPAHEFAQNLAALRRIGGHREILQKLTNVGSSADMRLVLCLIIGRHATSRTAGVGCEPSSLQPIGLALET
jgi:hypothetical protein